MMVVVMMMSWLDGKEVETGSGTFIYNIATLLFLYIYFDFWHICRRSYDECVNYGQTRMCKCICASFHMLFLIVEPYFLPFDGDLVCHPGIPWRSWESADSGLEIAAGSFISDSRKKCHELPWIHTWNCCDPWASKELWNKSRWLVNLPDLFWLWPMELNKNQRNAER